MSPHVFADWLPELSGATQDLLRTLYGCLLLGTLVMALPHAGRFFLSERWGGYAQSSVAVDLIQNPLVGTVLMAVWLTCGVLITIGTWSPWAALLNLLLCRYFFIHMRWKGVLCGMGAPGFMSYW